MTEERKEPTRLEKLGYRQAFSCLVEAFNKAKQIEVDQNTKVFAVGVMFMAENTNFVYSWGFDHVNKEALRNFVKNIVDKNLPVRGDIYHMLQDIQKYLEGGEK